VRTAARTGDLRSIEPDGDPSACFDNGALADGGIATATFSYYDDLQWRSTARPASTASVTMTAHAVEHEMVSIDLDPDADPPKVLVIGPDPAGNLLEIIVLVLEDDRLIAIHAMRLRRHFYELLPGEEGPT